MITPSDDEHALMDAARRAAELVTLAALAGDTGRWLAVRLFDGGTDGTVYDTRADAVSHQLHESLCTYVRITPDGMREREAYAVLRWARAAYATGYRMPDPQAPAPITPIPYETIMRTRRHHG